jgi:hypothetical protein
VQEYLQYRVDDGEIADATWFPVLLGHGFVLMYCGTDESARGQVVGYSPPEDWPTYRPASLAEPMERWAGYLEDGIWRRDPNADWTDYLNNRTVQTDLAQGNLP